MGSVSFTVFGKPEPAGSKKGVPGGRFTQIVDANAKASPWKDKVEEHAESEMLAQRAGRLLEGALSARFTFYLTRPTSHLGRGGVLPSAPDYPTVRPDALKLTRAVEDALTSAVYADDAQIVTELVHKRYAEPGEPACVVIVIEELEP